MGRLIDISGQKFGRLTVIARHAVSGTKGNARWICLCDCGKETIAIGSELRNGHKKSCGCLAAESGGRDLKDLTGQRFGMLTVVRRVENDKLGRAKWLCKCDCGGETSAMGFSLRRDQLKSCGCYIAGKFSEFRNRYSLAGKVFGWLTVISEAERRDGARRWSCLCKCGKTAVVKTGVLMSGYKRSCGCARRETNKVTPLLPEHVRNRIAAAQSARRASKSGTSGRFTEHDIQMIYDRQRGMCAWCGVSLKNGFSRDHRKALKNGGSNDKHNMECLCTPCNLKKGAKDEIAWANECGRLI